MFVTVSHFHPGLIFEGKAGIYSGGAPHSSSKSSLLIMVKGTDGEKHSSLLQYEINYKIVVLDVH